MILFMPLPHISQAAVVKQKDLLTKFKDLTKTAVSTAHFDYDAINPVTSISDNLVILISILLNTVPDKYVCLVAIKCNLHQRKFTWSIHLTTSTLQLLVHCTVVLHGMLSITCIFFKSHLNLHARYFSTSTETMLL